MKELQDFTISEYQALLRSGMMFELYPEATGNYNEDLDPHIVKIDFDPITKQQTILWDLIDK